MNHDSVADHLADVLIGIAPDVLETVMESLNDGHIDITSLDQDDVIDIVSYAIIIAAGKSSKRYLEQNRGELRAAIGRALIGPRARTEASRYDCGVAGPSTGAI